MITGTATILDNRDGTTEDIIALGDTFHKADASAFLAAASEAKERSAREGWARFVPIRAISTLRIIHV